MQRVAMITEQAYPFHTPTHPDAAWIEATALQWAAAAHLFAMPSVAKRCAYAEFGWLAARTAPHLPREHVLLVAKWCIFFFLYDDVADEQPVHRPTMPLQIWYARMHAVLAARPPHASDHPLFHAFDALLCDTEQANGAQDCTRLRQHLADYVRGGEWEAANRLQQQMPNLASYWVMRPFTGGLFAFLEIICLLRSIDRSGQLRGLPHCRTLTDTAIALVSLSNDVLSADREAAVGEIHNVVLILEQAHGIERTAACTQTIAIHNQLMHTFVAACATTPPLHTPTQRADYAAYVHVLRCMVRGTFDWTCATLRYAMPAEHRMHA